MVFSWLNILSKVRVFLLFVWTVSFFNKRHSPALNLNSPSLLNMWITMILKGKDSKLWSLAQSCDTTPYRIWTGDQWLTSWVQKQLIYFNVCITNASVPQFFNPCLLWIDEDARQRPMTYILSSKATQLFQCLSY